MYKRFSEWVQGKDIFGFESEVMPIPKKMVEEKPVKEVNVEELTKILSRYELGPKRPWAKWTNEVQWGFGTGAIRARVDQKLKVVIERLNWDFSGNPRWFVKKVYQLDRKGNGGHEDEIAQEVFDSIQDIDKKELDSPQKNYEEMEDLIEKLVDAVKKTASPIFIFEGVRKVNDQNYIIRMSVRGHGNEARDHHRILENQTQIIYDKEAGLIRLTNYNLQNKVGEDSKWQIGVPDQSWYFFPTQDIKEIAEALGNIVYWY